MLTLTNSRADFVIYVWISAGHKPSSPSSPSGVQCPHQRIKTVAHEVCARNVSLLVLFDSGSQPGVGTPEGGRRSISGSCQMVVENTTNKRWEQPRSGPGTPMRVGRSLIAGPDRLTCLQAFTCCGHCTVLNMISTYLLYSLRLQLTV